MRLEGIILVSKVLILLKINFTPDHILVSLVFQSKCPITDLSKAPREIFSSRFCLVASKCGLKDMVYVVISQHTFLGTERTE